LVTRFSTAQNTELRELIPKLGKTGLRRALDGVHLAKNTITARRNHAITGTFPFTKRHLSP
jgi:hypothetical protein